MTLFQSLVATGIVFIAAASLFSALQAARTRREVADANALLTTVLSTLRDRL